MDFVLIPNYSLSPTSLTLYETYENSDGFIRPCKGWENLNDNENKYGELSDHARKRLKKAINFMLYLTKEKEIQSHKIITKHQEFTTEYQLGEKHDNKINYKLTFITLTLPAPQQHTDNEIKSKCLNHFLIELKRKFYTEKYIWKAEKQENGNIHFHILTDKFCHHAEIRKIWNKIIGKLNYVSEYQKRQKRFYSDGFRMSQNPHDKRNQDTQLKAYLKAKEEDFLNPNSTDIHALYKVRNIGAYMSKYLAKSVTKSDRINQIKTLESELYENKIKITQIEKELFYYSPEDSQHQQIQAELRKKVERNQNIESALESLLQLGVQGKIWGCSQQLSKSSNYRESCNYSDIPHIDKIISESKNIYETQIGTRSLTSYQININQYPILKQKLDSHLLNNLVTQ